MGKWSAMQIRRHSAPLISCPKDGSKAKKGGIRGRWKALDLKVYLPHVPIVKETGYRWP